MCSISSGAAILGALYSPFPAQYLGGKNAGSSPSLPRGGGGGTTHYSVGSGVVQDHSMSKCSAGTTLHYTTQHCTALHHGVLLPSFCGIDLHPSQQTARLRSHRLVFVQIMDLCGATMNFLAGSNGKLILAVRILVNQALVTSQSRP